MRFNRITCTLTSTLTREFCVTFVFTRESAEWKHLALTYISSSVIERHLDASACGISRPRQQRFRRLRVAIIFFQCPMKIDNRDRVEGITRARARTCGKFRRFISFDPYMRILREITNFGVISFWKGAAFSLGQRRDFPSAKFIDQYEFCGNEWLNESDLSSGSASNINIVGLWIFLQCLFNAYK